MTDHDEGLLDGEESSKELTEDTKKPKFPKAVEKAVDEARALPPRVIRVEFLDDGRQATFGVKAAQALVSKGRVKYID